MRRLLIFELAVLFITFSVQAGVIRGVLLNDDDPYFISGDDGNVYKAEWYWGSILFYEGDRVLLTNNYGQVKMINEDEDEVADVLVEEISARDSIPRSAVVTPNSSVSAPTPAPTPMVPATPTPSIGASTPRPTDIGAAWPDGRTLLHPDQFVRTRVVNVAANDTLKLRSGPGTSFRIIAEIPANETNITAFDQDQIWDGKSWWCPVEWKGLRGYVSRSCLPK